LERPATYAFALFHIEKSPHLAFCWSGENANLQIDRLAFFIVYDVSE
jgi:hypothetical protein